MKSVLLLFLCLTLILGVGLTISCSSSLTDRDSHERAASGDAASFASVKPLFEHRCFWCHNNDVSHAGLNFQDRNLVLDPERKFIVPGDPDGSTIYLAVTRSFKHPRVMPGDGWGISERHQQALRRWIEAGAPWPEGRKGRLQRKSYQVDIDDL